MKTRALALEMREAFAALRPDDRQELLDYGVHARDIDSFQMVGTAKIRLEGDVYEPDDTGSWAFISPVLVHFPNSPETPEPDIICRFGNIVDLLAWRPEHPNKWAMRTGLAEWLGAIEPQYCKPDPVHVWQSPLDWFRSGCCGLVILTRDQLSAYRILSGCVGGIIAEDAEHQHQLNQILSRSFPAPAVLVGDFNRDIERHAA